jgi:hypothetical protein
VIPVFPEFERYRERITSCQRRPQRGRELRIEVTGKGILST